MKKDVPALQKSHWVIIHLLPLQRDLWLFPQKALRKGKYLDNERTVGIDNLETETAHYGSIRVVDAHEYI